MDMHSIMYMYMSMYGWDPFRQTFSTVVDICIAFGMSRAVLSLVIDITVWNGIVSCV